MGSVVYVYRKRFTINCLCLLFMGVGVKHGSWRINRKYIGLERNTEEKKYVNRAKVALYVINYISCEFSTGVKDRENWLKR
jgi:hypothetical protein